tara:strand:- start:772 stop:1065 length:294 start_codon:yes stop_codon:yes gene_type:complete
MRLNSLDSTEKKILKFFKERDIDLGPIENNVARKNFVKEGLLESITVVELVMFVESEFEVTLDAEMLGSERFQTIEGIADILREYEKGSDPDETSHL